MEAKKILECYEKYINPIYKIAQSSYSFSKDIFLKGKGVYIYTDKKKKILDITGGIGVLNLGHNHPKILRERINFQKNYYLEVHKDIFSRHLAKLSKKISDVLPNDLTMSVFCNSGTEANEGAIKTAHKFHDGGRKTILCSNIGFHGKSIGVSQITASLRKRNFIKGLSSKAFTHNSLDSIKLIIKNNIKRFGYVDIFAIIIEPYSHTQVAACDYKFLKGVRKLCNKYKIILIYDEIYTGWCKTGTLFYFMRHKGICPDILTTSKSLGGGKASIAAYVMKRKIFKKSYGNSRDFGLPSTTFNGFGEECVTALKAIEILQNKKYCKAAINIEKITKKRFISLSKKFPEYKMNLKGCGAIQKIFFNNSNLVQEFINNKLNKKEKSLITLIKTRILEASILDELYFKYKIWAFQSISKLVISPSLIIKSKELSYVFDSLEKILNLGIENIIKNYINRLKK